MHEYPKTENVFTRDPDSHKLNIGDMRMPEQAQLQTWLVTEKVDGTNIRILFRLKDGEPVYDVRGRSDRANVPKDLVANIRAVLDERQDSITEWLMHLTDEDENIMVCVYGEGFGPGIQKVGGNYGTDKAFVMFDVTTTHVEPWPSGEADGPTWWRGWNEVEIASMATGLPTVPVLGSMSLDEIVEFVSSRPASSVPGADLTVEGVIARTDPYLYDYKGHRVMFKFKVEDVPDYALAV